MIPKALEEHQILVEYQIRYIQSLIKLVYGVCQIDYGILLEYQHQVL
jgi:hypothetical protein